MFLKHQTWLVYLIWGVLVIEIVSALIFMDWAHVFVGGATLALTMVPSFAAERYHIRIPVFFSVGVVLFVFGTLYLGEAFNFYERFWWWDIVLHGSSALGFGLVGIIFVLTLFEGDRYAAPAWAMSLIAFAIAMSIGAIWEIFEFSMDQLFGTNMQKSGLMDTMADLITDAVGGLIGAGAGYAYLRGRQRGLAGVIRQVLHENAQFFRKFR